ncbi:MAG: TolC family protein [Candidatus Marinimicrobia bacterium]|nr:TolC family protein [Candidatus Neomarinimicrobiota bacterium]
MRKFLIFTLLIVNVVFAQKELSLQECIEIAMKNNPDVTMASLDVKSAKYGIKGSYSGILPSISTGLNWSHNNQGEREFYVGGVKQIQPETSSNSYGFGVRYDQTLYDGGGWWNQIELAKNNYKTALVSKRQVKQNLTAYVTQQYYSILKAKKLLEVYQTSLKTSQQQLLKTKEMYELGQVAKKDFLKAKVQKGNDELNIIQQERQIKALKNELSTLLGYEDKEFSVQEKDYESPQSYQKEPALQTAMENNIELRSLEFQKKNAQLQYAMAQSNLLPNLSTNLSYSKGGSQADRIYSDFDKFWNTSIGLNLSVPIFQGFSTKTRIQQSKIDYEKYNSRIKGKKLEITQNIKDLIENLNTYNKMLEINQFNLESAQEDLRSAQEMYRLNSATMLEVLDAQANLTQARSNLISTKYDAKIAEVNLKYHLGSL